MVVLNQTYEPTAYSMAKSLWDRLPQSEIKLVLIDAGYNAASVSTVMSLIRRFKASGEELPASYNQALRISRNIARTANSGRKPKEGEV
jgi:hypothetical protein